ncbi:MAG: 6-phosphogluconolactonase, partial [Verrucomicrobiales bacterium]|nr:6-phosphogluconolactonase [Verrucomicrobiales bacterium]
MANFDINVYPTDILLARTVAQRWLDAVAEANSKKQPYLVALSGGRITKAFFSVVVELAKQSATNLENVHFFWADERCVPPTDPESNFFLADQLLFQPLAIHPRQIHRLRGEAEPQVAVDSAIFELNALAGKTPTGQPQFDLILLGMGEDGHVASLFPNASAEVIDCPSPYLWIDNSPKPPPKRISLSYATIVAAKDVWVLVSGAGKENAFKESTASDRKTPLGRVLQLRSG